MMSSTMFTKIYDEIRLLMKAKRYEAAYHALPDLEARVMTNKQTAIYQSLEDYLTEKLEEPEDVEDES